MIKVMIGTILVLLLSVLGCTTRPTTVHSYPSPDPQVSYKVEETQGGGPLSASSTSVLVVFRSGKKAKERLVLTGTYLEINQVRWITKNSGELCISGGYTETYRNDVFLKIGEETRTIATHLNEHCS